MCTIFWLNIYLHKHFTIKCITSYCLIFLATNVFSSAFERFAYPVVHCLLPFLYILCLSVSNFSINQDKNNSHSKSYITKELEKSLKVISSFLWYLSALPLLSLSNNNVFCFFREMFSDHTVFSSLELPHKK